MTVTDLTPKPVDVSSLHEPGRDASRRGALLTPQIVRRAMRDAVKKLHPRTQVRKPVMFVVFVGSLLTTYLFVRNLPTASGADSVFTGLAANVKVPVDAVTASFSGLELNLALDRLQRGA